MKYAAALAAVLALAAFLASWSEPADPVAAAMAAPPPSRGGVYDFSEAAEHIGERASVAGTPVKVYRSKKGTVFFDYCEAFASCPFSAVIFAADAKRFGSLSRYEKTPIVVTGVISSYRGRAEMILESPEQISAP